MTNNNKSILIFGGTGGIGSRTAQKFIDSGWKVILASRGNREAEQAVSQNSDVVLETVDAANESEVEELFAKHSDSNINAIVNCVGSIYLKPLHITSIDDWNNVITTNLTTSFIILKYGIKYFRTHKIKGSFVFSSTAATHVAKPSFTGPYRAA
jgi:NAD(P)-dependent dehydrogenase (short-subunit alcohol dehydrogenase family)